MIDRDSAYKQLHNYIVSEFKTYLFAYKKANRLNSSPIESK